jgi:tetratricopeptide (TPR) repeat protein
MVLLSNAWQDHATAGLGVVHFATSCSAPAQQVFDRAIAMLHSFEYEAANKEFEKVVVLDEGCAMAEWGIAMSKFRQLWQPPSADEASAANTALDKAESQTSTIREHAYILAAREVYRDVEKRSYTERVNAYSVAMEGIYKDYPHDREAAAFYALSLVALSQLKNDNAHQQQASAILERLFIEAPDHPGVAHYLIHSYDQPDLAPRGLKAARAYAKIAPASIHALHMPSHIFVDLGLWQESIDSNIAAFNASRNRGDTSLRGYSDQLHAIDFIIYSALQIGKNSIASEYAQLAKTVPQLNDIMATQVRLDFPARIAIEQHDWPTILALAEPNNSKPNTRGRLYLMQVMAAARLGNPVLARQILGRFQNTVADLSTSRDPELVSWAQRANKLLIRPSAWLDLAEGRPEQGIEKLRAAADQEHAAGFSIPAAEMLGDMLVAAKRPQDAIAAYEQALKVSPGRFNSLYGAANAAELAGNTILAIKYYSALQECCNTSSRPEVAKAKRFVSSHKQTAKD